MMVGWGVSAILTTADVLSSDRNNVQFYARTDTRSHVITNSPWFSFPYPGTLEWWGGGVRGRTLSFFHSLSFLSFPHTLILRFSVSFCVIPSLVFSLFSSFPPLSFYHFFFLFSFFPQSPPFSLVFLFIFCHFFLPPFFLSITFLSPLPFSQDALARPPSIPASSSASCWPHSCPSWTPSATTAHARAPATCRSPPTGLWTAGWRWRGSWVSSAAPWASATPPHRSAATSGPWASPGSV